MKNNDDYTKHPHICDCSSCLDVNYKKSVKKLFDVYLTDIQRAYATGIGGQKKTEEEIQKIVLATVAKLSLLGRYFPEMNVPRKHKFLIDTYKID